MFALTQLVNRHTFRDLRSWIAVCYGDPDGPEPAVATWASRSPYGQAPTPWRTLAIRQDRRAPQPRGSSWWIVTSGASLSGLMSDVTRAVEVPDVDIVGLLRAIVEQEAALGTLKCILAARLLTIGNAQPEARKSEARPLTQREAADEFRIPLRKLRFLTRTRRVPSYLQGRNRMVRPGDVDRYIARCRDQGVPLGTILDV